jgi:hypothetical protein
MTSIMKALITTAAIFALLFTITTLVMAQPGLPSGPTQVPIDGGLGFLAAAGGAYAIKKLRDRNAMDDSDSNLVD